MKYKLNIQHFATVKIGANVSMEVIATYKSNSVANNTYTYNIKIIIRNPNYPTGYSGAANSSYGVQYNIAGPSYWWSTPNWISYSWKPLPYTLENFDVTREYPSNGVAPTGGVKVNFYGGSATSWFYSSASVTAPLSIPSITRNYTVSFNSAGGTSVSNQTVTHGGKASVPSAPTRTGYYFDGWTPSITGTTITSNTTFTAQWRIMNFTVSFNADGGSPTPSRQYIDYNSTVSTPTTPSKEGHDFAGWSPSLSTRITRTTTFTAVWSRKSYTVSFNSMGGSYVPSQTVYYGSTVSYPSTPTRQNYVFTGWSPYIYTTITQNMTFYAQWELEGHTVTFNSMGGSTVASQNVVNGNYASVPSDPTRTGYTFNGWVPNIYTTAITSNTTFVAQWLIKSYTVNYNANGGSLTPSEVVEYNHTATVPNDPVRENYIFTGWTPSISTRITKNTTFTANWKIKTYTVSFDTGAGGPKPANQTIDHGDLAIVPSEPTLADHNFIRWEPSIIETPIVKNTTFTAIWGFINNIVKFKTDGGNYTPGDQIIDYGEYITVPTPPTKDGYTFAGWRPSVLQPILEPTTFNAVWIRIVPPVEIKFDTEIKIRVKDNKVSRSKIFKSESYATNIIIDFSDTNTEGLEKYANVEDPEGNLHVYELGTGDIGSFWLKDEVTFEKGFILINPMVRAGEDGSPEVMRGLFQTYKFELLDAIDNGE